MGPGQHEITRLRAQIDWTLQENMRLRAELADAKSMAGTAFASGLREAAALIGVIAVDPRPDYRAALAEAVALIEARARDVEARE